MITHDLCSVALTAAIDRWTPQQSIAVDSIASVHFEQSIAVVSIASLLVLLCVNPLSSLL